MLGQASPSARARIIIGWTDTGSTLTERQARIVQRGAANDGWEQDSVDGTQINNVLKKLGIDRQKPDLLLAKIEETISLQKQRGSLGLATETWSAIKFISSGWKVVRMMKWHTDAMKRAAVRAESARSVFLKRGRIPRQQQRLLEELVQVFKYSSTGHELVNFHGMLDEQFICACRIVRALRTVKRTQQTAPLRSLPGSHRRTEMELLKRDFLLIMVAQRVQPLRALYASLSETEQKLRDLLPAKTRGKQKLTYSKWQAASKRAEIFNDAAQEAIKWDQRNEWAKGLAQECSNKLGRLADGKRTPLQYPKGHKSSDAFICAHYKLIQVEGLKGACSSILRELDLMLAKARKESRKRKNHAN